MSDEKYNPVDLPIALVRAGVWMCGFMKGALATLGEDSTVVAKEGSTD